MKFNIKDQVILNKSGKDCYERNTSYKKIPPNKIMDIVGTAGFDNGKYIYIVEWNNLQDYYFEGCLEKVDKKC